MIRRIHESPWFVVDHNPADRVYRVARSNKPFADLAEVERGYGGFELVLTTVPPGSRLLFDSRDAVPRNDAEFEAALIPIRDRAFARFAKVAILVKTAVGRLQVQRMNQGLPDTVAVFDDEDRAFDFLLD